MIVRRDHVAGGAFIVAGVLVLAVSSDLPFGTLASPGAGMLPTLVIGLLILLGAVVFARAGESPPVSEIVWEDVPHAVRVAVFAAAAVALYTVLGFRITMAALLFVLTFVVERRPFLPAVAFSIGVTALAYGLFGLLLKTPLPRGLFGF
jgi:tripartite tricarboxylate transporter TctB family protein